MQKPPVCRERCIRDLQIPHYKRQTDRAVVSVDSGVNYILFDRGVRYCIGLNSGKPKFVDDNAFIGSQQGESIPGIAHLVQLVSR